MVILIFGGIFHHLERGDIGPILQTGNDFAQTLRVGSEGS